MKVGILYYRYLDLDGKNLDAGGIETYIYNLCMSCQRLGYIPEVFQTANRNFEEVIEGTKVHGIAINDKMQDRNIVLFRTASAALSMDKDILVFGSDICSVKTPLKRTVSIQHGVSWDLPTRFHTKKWYLRTKYFSMLKRIQLFRQAVTNFDKCYNRVCVDYNFLNWYRTIVNVEPAGKIWVILNCGRLASQDEIKAKRYTGPIKIIFARRFTEYRGSRIIGNLISGLSDKYRDIKFTLAGEGPEETYFRETIAKRPNVTIIKYKPADSLRIHLEHQVAIVPSLASEGSAYAVSEAMCAGCAVVASNIGGITNVIIDKYNGMLSMPTTEAFLRKLEDLIDDRRVMQEIGKNAFRTATAALGYERWAMSWGEVLNTIAKS